MAVNGEDTQTQQQNSQSQGQTQAQGTGQALSGSGSVGSAVGSSGRIAQFSNGASPNQSGSGRFTNLQKYIGANEGAGDRLYSGINANIDRSTSQEKKDTNTQAQNVGQAVADAQNKLNTGNQYLSSISGSDNTQNLNNVNSIAGDTNKLNDYLGYQNNTAIGASNVASGVNNAQQTAQNYQTDLQNKLNQVGSETGRYQLLANAFGGGTAYKPTYTTGQQRLDNLFLQASGNNNIANLQNNLNSQLNNVNQTVNNLNNQANTVSTLGNQASTLAKNLQNQSNTLLNDYYNNIGSADNLAAINAARNSEYQNDLSQYSNLQNNKNISSDFANLLGLTAGQSIYNGANQDATNYFTYGGDVTSANQAANDAQRSQYANLANLAGLNQNAWNITSNGAAPAAVSVNKDAFQQALQNASTAAQSNNSYNLDNSLYDPSKSGNYTASDESFRNVLSNLGLGQYTNYSDLANAIYGNNNAWQQLGQNLYDQNIASNSSNGLSGAGTDTLKQALQNYFNDKGYLTANITGNPGDNTFNVK